MIGRNPKHSIEEVFKGQSSAYMHLLGNIRNSLTVMDAEFRAQFEHIVEKLQTLSDSGLKSQQDIASLRTELRQSNLSPPLDVVQNKAHDRREDHDRKFQMYQSYTQDQLEQITQKLESMQTHFLGQIAAISREVVRSRADIDGQKFAEARIGASVAAISTEVAELRRSQGTDAALAQLLTVVECQQRDIKNMRSQMAFLHSRLAVGESEVPTSVKLIESIGSLLLPSG